MMIPNRPNSKLMHDKLPLAGRGFNRTYPANSLQPQLVLDAGENYFRKDGSRDSFSNVFTHSRTSGATYLDSTGTLQTAASGEIRDQAYAYVDGVLTGPYIQLESAAVTNLVTYSAEFDNAAWLKVRSTITSNAIVALDGTLTADKLVEDTDTGEKYIQQAASYSAGIYTHSIYVKAAENSKFAIRPVHVDVAGGDPTSATVFDLATETITASPSSAYVTATLEAVGDDWYRASVTVANSGTVTLFAFRFHLLSDGGALSYTGDGTSGIYIYGAQLEASPIPTSYIPTSGSTATRAAETLTIANPPWPATVEATGTELVTNGTFDTDTDWTKAELGSTADTPTIAGGSATLNRVDASNFGYIHQSLTLTNGSIYKLDFTSQTAPVRYRVGVSALGFESLNFAQAAAGASSVLFVAGATNVLSFFCASDGQTATIDNISVKEITPRGLAIAIDGLVTYADRNFTEEVNFAEWELDTSNYIKMILRTDGATDRIDFSQNAGGTFDRVLTGDTYSPGINVPFSIASRHGDNFINGAVDGTALTADLTPTILPDLSATPIQIAPTFNGYINTLRIWDEDIGDAGIASASNSG